MLEIERLARRFGPIVALDGVTFTVAAEGMHGFVGPNGSGKTTTMRAVMGVMEPDAGAIRWRGVPVDAAARRRFGYMPEERGLYPKMRVRDQLVHFARLHGTDAAAAAASADRWIERLGLVERAGDRVERLSLGNQQRVQLAAALVHEPELLVLDEPFSGLDPVGVDMLSAELAELARAGVAILFSSHQLELVERICSAVTIVREGRVVVTGQVRELRVANAPAGRVRVVFASAPPAGWLPAGLAALVDGDHDTTFQVDVSGGSAGIDAVLDAARAAGSIRHFNRVEPTLADLFREAVAPQETDEAHPGERDLVR
jgi:ABC-2 type transport system ATP-binding protein